MLPASPFPTSSCTWRHVTCQRKRLIAALFTWLPNLHRLISTLLSYITINWAWASMARMQSPVRTSTPGVQDDRPSRTDRLKSFVRSKSRTPSPSKTRAKEAISHAKPVHFPQDMVTPHAFMLPPDHPHAKLVLGDVNHNRQSPERTTHGSPRRAGSGEAKLGRPESSRALNTPQQSPSKYLARETILADKENYTPATPSHLASPPPIWAEFASPRHGGQTNRLQQDFEPMDSAEVSRIMRETGNTSADPLPQDNKTSTSKPFTVQSRSTIGSITSASSMDDGARGTSKSSLPSFVARNGSIGDLRDEELDAAFEAVLVSRAL